jgi:hypothetical protein
MDNEILMMMVANVLMFPAGWITSKILKLDLDNSRSLW